MVSAILCPKILQVVLLVIIEVATVTATLQRFLGQLFWPSGQDTVPKQRGRETSQHKVTNPFYPLVHAGALTHSLASDRRSIMDGPMSTEVRILKKPSYVLHAFNWPSLFTFSPWTRPFTSLCSLCCLPTTSGGGITQRCHRQDRGLFPWSETC